jgi:hypothetical protein
MNLNLEIFCNINNKINGDANYNYTNATYAPFGRPYWTIEQTFEYIAGYNALIYCNRDMFIIKFLTPQSGQNWNRTTTCKILDASMANFYGITCTISS